MFRFLISVVLSSLAFSPSLHAQQQDLPADPKELVESDQIPRYVAARATEPLKIDGKLNEPSWTTAARTNRFVDLISGERTIHATNAAILWDDDFLYIGFWVEDPMVTARYEKRDAPIYRDNDVEVFIAGKDTYYEFEINAYGTMYEAFFIWSEAYERDGYDQIPGLRRSDAKVRPFNGVGFRRHPRGPRIGCFAWDFPDLKSAVHVDGTINNNRDRDRGWTVELAFPWKGMSELAKGDGRSLPPNNGDTWRMDLSRFNRFREAPPARDSGGWAVGKHGVWDSHLPEIFPFVTFAK